MKIRNSTGIQDIPHLLPVSATIVHPQSVQYQKQSPLSIVHISTGQHAVAVQQLDRCILHGHDLSVSLLVDLQHDPLSQNRADDKEQRHQAQHHHNVPMEFSISVEGTRGVALATGLPEEPNRNEELEQIGNHEPDVPHYLVGITLAAHHVHEELVEAAGQDVQQGDANNAEDLLWRDHVGGVGQVHH